jgi:hypothetical protein
MALSIESALDRTVQQLSSDKRVQENAKAAFKELFNEIFQQQLGAAPADTGAGAPSAAATATPTTLYSLDPPPAVATRDVVSTGALSLLKDPNAAALEQLPGDLKAGDPQYNTREVELRGRLNLTELESRLRSMASSCGVEYDSSDLDGVLRNAGYDATHLGATSRYMSAIEHFMSEADNNYHQRAGNAPGAA